MAVRWRALLLVMALGLAACLGDPGGTERTGPEAAGDQGTVVLGVENEPDTLNPILGYAQDGTSKIFDGLVARDAGLNLVPALAEALPEVSPDGLTYTFRLREGVRFHDGTPLTAQDVVFTYRTILDERTDTGLRSDIDMIADVSAPDDDTVVFRLSYPYTPFTQRTTIGIVPAKALEGQDVNAAAFNTAPVGTGPFVFEEWTPGDRLTLRANPDYWGGKPAIERLVLAFVADENVRATRMERGDFDGTHLPPKLATRFRNRDDVTVWEVPSADYRGVMLPLERPVTGDLAIRRALSLAIDRNALVDGLLLGAGGPAYGPISPATDWYNKAIEPTGGGLDAARAVLADGGWTPGPDGILQRAGQPARFTLMYPAQDSLRKDLALAVASTGAQIGIDVQLEGLDWDAIEPRMVNDALIMGWGTPYDPDFTNYQLFHSAFVHQGFFNPGGLRDPEIDRILDEGRRSDDPQVRAAAYDELQTRLADQAVWSWLVYLDHVYVVENRFAGLEVQTDPHAHGSTHGIWWNIERWKPTGETRG